MELTSSIEKKTSQTLKFLFLEDESKQVGIYFLFGVDEVYRK